MMNSFKFIPLLVFTLFSFNSIPYAQVFVESEKPEAVANQLFGWAIDSEWDVAIVTAPQKDIGDRQSVGSAYIYRLNDERWEIEQEISPENLPASSSFGISAAIMYETAFIGSLGHPEAGLFSESVFVYEQSDTSWVQTQILRPSDLKIGSRFGYSISALEYGGLLAIGAYNADGNESKTGAVYLFENIDGDWIQSAKLVAEDGQSNDFFGYSVSINGNNRISIGAYNATGASERSGAVYIFEKNGEDEWIQTDKIYDPSGASSDLFGYSLTSIVGVSIPVKAVSVSSEDAIYIGSPGSNNEENKQTGSVYIYGYDGENWQLRDQLFEPNSGHNDHFGISLAYNTYNGLFVGANRNGNNNEGSIYKYLHSPWIDNAPPELVPFSSTGSFMEDGFYASKISTDTKPNVIIASPNADVEGIENSGSVEFYTSLISSNEEEVDYITEYKLEQNYPNPFNPTTTINYQVKEAGHVKLTVFNLLGQQVQVLVNEQKVNGAYTANFNASALSSGFYFYRLEVNDFSSTKKMMLIK